MDKDQNVFGSENDDDGETEMKEEQIDDEECEEKCKEQGKVPKIDPDLSAAENAKKIITPLWEVPVENQVKQKQEKVRDDLDLVLQQVMIVNPKLEESLKKKNKNSISDLCEFSDLKQSPVTTGYRNRCDFSVGLSLDTKEPAVGIQLYVEEDGSPIVGPVEDLIHIPEKLKTAAKVFEKFVRDSGKPPFNKKSLTGCWHRLVARVSTSGSLLLVVVFSQGTLNKTELDEIKESIKTFFQSGEGKTCDVNSVHYQAFRGKKFTKRQTVVRHLIGTSYLEEKVLGMTLRLSPLTFFHVNTKGAEVLYKVVGDVINVKEDTTLLDICCGAGPIGISLSKKCLEVIGIDQNQQSIQDCFFNAKRNRVRRYKYFQGRIKETLPMALQHVTGNYIVAILDIPVPGEKNSACLLRNIPQLREIIFIASELKSSIPYIQDLCHSTNTEFHGTPFMPVKAIPIDLYPHTNHCEVVIVLKRKVQLPMTPGAVPLLDLMSQKRPMPHPFFDQGGRKRMRYNNMQDDFEPNFHPPQGRGLLGPAPPFEYDDRYDQMGWEEDDGWNRGGFHGERRYEEERYDDYPQHRRPPVRDSYGGGQYGMDDNYQEMQRGRRDYPPAQHNFQEGNEPSQGIITTLLQNDSVKKKLLNMLANELGAAAQNKVPPGPPRQSSYDSPSNMQFSNAPKPFMNKPRPLLNDSFGYDNNGPSMNRGVWNENPTPMSSFQNSNRPQPLMQGQGRGFHSGGRGGMGPHRGGMTGGPRMGRGGSQSYR